MFIDSRSINYERLQPTKVEQRLLVFVSSAVEELKKARVEIRKCIEALGLCDPWLFEFTSASTKDLEEFYLENVKTSDVFIQILDRNVTYPVKNELATALAYKKPILIFVKRRTKRSLDLADYIGQMKEQKIKYTEYSSIDQLVELVRESVLDEIIAAYRKQLSQHDYTPLFDSFHAEISRASINPDLRIRRAALAALSELSSIGDKRAVETIIDNLKDFDPKIRWSAAAALGKINAPKAADVLIEALTDTDGFVRGAAALALGKLKSEKAVDPLIELLHDDQDVNARRGAAEALGEIGDPIARQALVRALDDVDKGVRTKSAIALVRFGQSAVDPLIQLIKTKRGEETQVAETVLGQLGEIVIEPIIKLFMNQNDFVQNAAARIFRYMEHPPVNRLIQLLDHEDLQNRHRAAQALSFIGDRRATKPIAKLLKEKSDIRWNAAVYLGCLRDPAAGGPLIEALPDDDPYFVTEVGSALISLDPPPVEALMHALDSENDKMRERAAWVLGKGQLGGARAIEKLHQLCLNDNNERVREAATWAVNEIQTD